MQQESAAFKSMNVTQNVPVSCTCLVCLGTLLRIIIKAHCNCQLTNTLNTVRKWPNGNGTFPILFRFKEMLQPIQTHIRKRQGHQFITGLTHIHKHTHQDPLRNLESLTKAAHESTQRKAKQTQGALQLSSLGLNPGDEANH